MPTGPVPDIIHGTATIELRCDECGGTIPKGSTDVGVFLGEPTQVACGSCSVDED